MRCEQCGTEIAGGDSFCKECGVPLGKGGAGEPGEREGAAEVGTSREDASTLAVFLSTAWSRKGPILMAFFLVLMMATVFAPWAFLKLDLPIVGIRIVSNTYSGWNIFVGRILFYLLIVPLLISLLMIAGISSRRQVVETHICTFFGGVVFTVWLVIFALSQVIASIIKNVKIVAVGAGSGQIITIFLFIGFMLGIIITSFDRGRALSDASLGG